MDFKYFANVENFGNFLPKEIKCDFCEEVTKCFDAELFTTKENIKTICPSCLKEGKLKEHNGATCCGDKQALGKQLEELNPYISFEEIDELVEKKTEELVTTTPQLLTWQDFDWPALDGDYCQFIGFGSQALFNKLAKDKNGWELFKTTFYDPEKRDRTKKLWKEYIHQKEIKNLNETTGNVLFYVFKSINSNKIIHFRDTMD